MSTKTSNAMMKLQPYVGQFVAISPAIYFSNGREFTVGHSNDLFGQLDDSFYYFDKKPSIIFMRVIQPNSPNEPLLFTNQNLNFDSRGQRIHNIKVRLASEKEVAEIKLAVDQRRATLEVSKSPGKEQIATRIWA